MKLMPAIFLILLTLKLCGVLAWSWWWITFPLWGLFLILFAFHWFFPDPKIPHQFRK